MEKLGQLVSADQWDLIVVDTPPSRSALDFLDAPQRLSSFLDGRMIRLLSAPARAGSRGVRRLVGAGFGLFSKAISTILGGQMLADASAFVQAFDTMFGGFRERATATYELLRAPGTAFVVVATPEADAVREAAYFVDRLATESMPLAGLVLNRTHPVLADLPAARAETVAETLEPCDNAPLAAAVLRLHADRVALAGRERRLLTRFRRAHPAVAVSPCRRWPSTSTTCRHCARSAACWGNRNPPSAGTDSGHRSSTRSSLRARETQISMAPAARSALVSNSSR